MNDKLKGYTQEPIENDAEREAARENAEIAAAEKETLEPELKPDPEVIVPTGDEAAPVTQPDHGSALNSLYDKARKNRELVSREDEAGAPDVATVKALVEEASGGARPSIDTNRPDRFEEEAGNYVEEVVEINEETGEETVIETTEVKTDEPEIVNEEVPEEPSSFTPPAPDDRVSVKILGKHYDVPQQDIDDAGGLEAYQKNRAATIRLQRAAILEQRVTQRVSATVSPPQPEEQEADPSTDGQSEADISVDALQAEMMDVVIDGNEDDIKRWIEQRLTKAQQPAKPTPPAEEPRPAVSESPEDSEILTELQSQRELDIEETNHMMNEEFPDIMKGSQPSATELERRRLADAQEYFQVLASDPHNEGRSQKEMAREAANRARRIRYPEEETSQPVPPIEQERRKRVIRKRRLPQASRADTGAPSNRKQEKKVPSRKDHFRRLRRAAGQDLTEDDLR